MIAMGVLLLLVQMFRAVFGFLGLGVAILGSEGEEDDVDCDD